MSASPTKTSSSNNWLLPVFFSIFAAVLTLHDADYIVKPGIDESYRWAINDLLAKSRGLLAGLIYPVGPLYIIKGPSVVGDHILISVIAQLMLQAAFTLQFLFLYKQFRPGSILAPLLICIVCMQLINIDYVLIGSVLLGVLSWHYQADRRQLLYAVFILVITFFTKTSIFVFSASIMASFVLMLLAGKRFREVLFILLTGIVLLIVSGWVIFGSLPLLFTYIGNTLFVCFGYSDTLNLYPYNNWWLFVISMALLIACLVFFFKQPGGYLLKLSLLCLFANWKYAIGQETFFHQAYFSFLLVLLIAIFIAIQVKNTLTGTVLLLLSLCFYNYNFKYSAGSPGVYWFPGFINFGDEVVHYNDFKSNALALSEENCKSNMLPDDWKNEINQSKVDVFPWDLSIIMINHFNYNYTPHPSLQNPPINEYALKKDIAFFQSQTAPAYLIWHASNFGHTDLDGVDDAYLPNQCLPLFETLICRYEQEKSIAGKVLLRKRAAPLKMTETTLSSEEAEWGTWINVPDADSNTLITATVQLNTNIRYSLASVFFKKAPQYIEYKKEDGSVIRYEFSANCAKKGLLINPMFTDPRLSRVKIKQVRFTNNDADYFGKKIKIVWKRAVEQD